MGAGGWPGPGLASTVSSAPRSLCALVSQSCLWLLALPTRGVRAGPAGLGRRGCDPASKSSPTMGPSDT